MKQSLMGALLGVAVLAGLVVIGLPGEVSAQRPGFEAGTELIALATPAGTDRQQVTIIDPKSRAMSVYHIDLSTGAVSLKSVRNIQYDLQLSDYQAVSPTPREIRATLESR